MSTRYRQIQLCSGCNQGKHPAGTARALLELDRCCNNDRAGRRQLIEVAKARKSESIRAVHTGMARKLRIERKRLTRIGTDRFIPKADNISGDTCMISGFDVFLGVT